MIFWKQTNKKKTEIKKDEGWILSLFLLMEKNIIVDPIYQTENVNTNLDAAYLCRCL